MWGNMFKKNIKRVLKFFLFVLSICFSLTACKNFLNGEDFLIQLEDSINYENTPSASLLITTDYGTVLNNGERSVKKGDSVKLVYSEGNSGYQFVKWNVEPSESVSFIEEDGIICDSTSIKIENTSRKITIKPVLYERPKIDTSKTLPAFVKSGVEKNSSIYFTFTKKLSPQNDFKRIRIEMVSSVEGQNIKLFGNEDSALDNFMLPTVDNYELTIAAKRDNYISLMNDVETIRVTIPGDFYYEVDGNKICFGAEQTYTYLINNQTVEQLEVSFSCDGGTITPNQRLTYSIGSHFDVIFTKSDEFIYKDWSVTAGGYIVEKCPNDEKDIAGYYKAWLKSETGEKTGEPITFLSYNKPDAATKIILEAQNMYKIEFTVLENLSGVSIKPDSRLLPKINDYEPKYVNTGNDYDTKSYVYFNKEMDINTFNYSNIEIVDNQNKTDYSKYFTFTGNTDNGKSVLTIVPSYDINELFTKDKKQIDIEINLKDGIKDLNGESLSGNRSWYYRIINQAEKVPPVITEIHLYSDNDPKAPFYRELTDKQESEWNHEEEYDKNVPTTYLKYGDYSRNHVSKIYISIQGYDENSGIEFLRVKEKCDNDIVITDYPNEQNPEAVFLPSYDENGNQKTDENGNKIYEINVLHNLKIEKEQFIFLEISFLDKTKNECDSKVYYLNKETKNTFFYYFNKVSLTDITNYKGKVVDLDNISNDNQFQLKLNLSSEYDKFPPPLISTLTKEEENILRNLFGHASYPYYPKFFSGFIYVNYFLTIELKNKKNSQIIYQGLNLIPEIENAINNVIIDNSITNKLIFTFYTENGTKKTDEYIIPDNNFLISVSEENGRLYFYPNDSEYEYKIYYKKDENTESSKLIYPQSDDNNISISDIYKFDNSDECIFYITKVYESNNFNGYSYESLPHKYIYKKCCNLPDGVVFPEFNSDIKFNIEYPLNESIANVTANIDSLNKNGKQFVIRCIEKSDNTKQYISTEPSFSIPSGYKYNLCFGLINDETISYKQDSVELDTTEKDNHSPDIIYSLDTIDDYAPNFARVHVSAFIDIDNEKKEVKINENGEKIITLMYFPYSSEENRIEIISMLNNDYQKAKSTLKKCFIKVTSTQDGDYFFVPSTYIGDPIDFIYVIEDESQNYSYDYNYYKNLYMLDEASPTVEFKDNSLKIVIDESLQEGSDSINYTTEFINIDNSIWNICDKSIYYYNKNNDNKNNDNINNELIDKDFIRVFTIIDNPRYDSYSEGVLRTLYVCPGYYTGTVQCNSHSWLKVSNGYQVFADAPTLCHTMYFPTKLTETNTKEDAYFWESKAIETGIMVKDSMFTYSDENLAEIPEGFYYTTICHFADGTILMSDINVK